MNARKKYQRTSKCAAHFKKKKISTWNLVSWTGLQHPSHLTIVFNLPLLFFLKPEVRVQQFLWYIESVK